MDKGHIYLVTSPSGKQYVGQTVCILSNGKKFGYKSRWRSHVQEATGNKGYCRILDNAIRKYGEDKFTIELIEEITIDLLDERERFWISEMKTLSPDGYNLTTGGGSHHELSEESKRILSEKLTGKLKTRQKPESEGLPLYLYHYKDTRCEGYKLSGHPTLPSKRFTSNDLDMETKLEMALYYLENSQDEKQEKVKLPQYIYNRNDGDFHGYLVKNHPVLKNKSFTTKTLSMEEKLGLAINYVNSSQS